MKPKATLRSIIVGLSAVLGACSSAGTEAPPQDAELEAARADLEDEFTTVRQALGEPGCGAAAADQVFDMTDPTRPVAGSTDGNYDHPECRNGFIIDLVGATAGDTLRGGMSYQRWPDPFTCLLNWGYLSLWQKQGNEYVKIREASALGQWLFNAPKLGTVCSALVALTIPQDGEYRLVAASGLLFGPTQRVTVFR